ncbi:hypothetical protein PF005_g3038 [Phytophthora fragariae]|uniref:Uncharacterized protein n=2 Tax=Phytophthora TaxID=4783 RepID=A0A6A3MC19_9STRA|nr:hypothetical protein PF003_g21799 [Phytophthora fragariae]KAE9023773.1 hypothetical protein PR002_g11637 [Phytophthora rubi]KAE8947098.1 hypothetical protein PF009_g3289 [Phytophthora fragariae]KAE9025763.1 hypothetical protein PF011_g2899 [Phytophthora fragariae]KAE9029838.1 hypothetical protein PR001_g11424 [Phytophthora rubi]
MLAYALARSKVQIIGLQPAPPSNSPASTSPLVSFEVTVQDESDPSENDQHDGLDFTRVRAELDRLLEEGLLEEALREGNEIDQGQEAQYTIDAFKYHPHNRPSQGPSAEERSRSL